jgi:hypothetical protein
VEELTNNKAIKILFMKVLVSLIITSHSQVVSLVIRLKQKVPYQENLFSLITMLHNRALVVAQARE